MKRMLLKIAYDGTDYHGWQVQPNGVTVQQTLQDALERLLGVRPSVTGCSRTDAGVHAREFFCHLDCEDSIPPEAFTRGLDSMLPRDIAVTGCREVENDFHARYRARGKLYIYRMYRGERSPFLSRYALRLENEPDIGRINRFCASVTGTHDFAPFSSANRTVEDTVRTVTQCGAEWENGILCLKISADGFLYNMVRIIAGTALEVSAGRLRDDCAGEIFSSGDRSLAGKTLPPQGLCLDKVFY